MLRCLLLVLGLTLFACAQKPVQQDENSNVVQPTPAGEYAKLINKNTASTDQYSGFYQTFQADATILTSEVQAALIKQKAAFQQWDQRQFQTEREKMLQEAAAYAKYFLRFYAPERDYDDLHKPKTIWKVYLEYAGSRFEGKIRKMNEKPVEIQMLFPYIKERFSTPYEVTFNVPMTTIEGGASKLILTSSLGSAEFKFPTSK
jgi:hypothetical protein